MSDFAINSAGSGPVGPVNRTTPAPHLNGTAHHGRAAQEPPAIDRVELSDFARHLDRLRQLPEVRLERIARAREAIEAGAYDSERVLDETIDRLADDLIE